MATDLTVPHAGTLLRGWGERRNLSQLALAADAAVSTRHLSFVETGRSTPSRELLLHLAERLDVPLRERNRLLLAGGYAPVFGERPLDGDELRPVREALEHVLAAHAPFPALVVDHAWTVLRMNATVGVLVEGVAAHLLEPPINALRVTFHPEGMAPAIVNLEEWGSHVIHRLDRAIASTGAGALVELRRELLGYPGVARGGPTTLSSEIVLPLRLRRPGGELSFLVTQTIFGTPTDITLAELSLEAFYPADAATAAALRDAHALSSDAPVA